MSKIINAILKVFIKFLTIIIQSLYFIYKYTFHQFFRLSKSNKWIVILCVLFVIVMTYSMHRTVSAINDTNNQQIHFLNVQNTMKNEINVLKDSIIEKDKTIKIQEDKIATLSAKLKAQRKVTSNIAIANKTIKPDIKQYIDKYCDQYGLNKELVSCMVFKESGGRPDAKNPSGKYVGLAQYSLSTFYSHRRKLGLPEVDIRTDPDASIQAMTSALARGEFSHWPQTSKMCL